MINENELTIRIIFVFHVGTFEKDYLHKSYLLTEKSDIKTCELLRTTLNKRIPTQNALVDNLAVVAHEL